LSRRSLSRVKATIGDEDVEDVEDVDGILSTLDACASPISPWLSELPTIPTTDLPEKSYPASPLTMCFEVDNMRVPPKCQNVEWVSNLK